MFNYFWKEKTLDVVLNFIKDWDFFLTHTNFFFKFGEYNRVIVCSLEFCWVVNHRFFLFSFGFLFYTTNV